MNVNQFSYCVFVVVSSVCHEDEIVKVLHFVIFLNLFITIELRLITRHLSKYFLKKEKKKEKKHNMSVYLIYNYLMACPKP